jgi:hypothetical protein
MSTKKSLVEFIHDEGYGDDLVWHINLALKGKDMRAIRVVAEETNQAPKPDSDICITQYRHPDITSGMHTNGRANMFVRMNKGDWYLVDRDRVRNQDTLRSLIAGLGIEQFIAYYCTLAEK